MRNLLLTSFLLLTFVSLAVAGPVLTFNEGTGSNGTNQGQSVGWRFNVLNSYTLNWLGWYDQSQDGLGHSHVVGIWDPQGILLTSANLPAGTGPALDGQYRAVPVTPLILSPGSGYIIGGLNFSGSGDRLAYNVDFVINSNLSFSDAMYSDLGGSLVRPTFESGAVNGFFGPMFGYSDAQIPEPSTALLLGSGLLIAGLLRRRFHA